jgi:hypothetical protein
MTPEGPIFEFSMREKEEDACGKGEMKLKTSADPRV